MMVNFRIRLLVTAWEEDFSRNVSVLCSVLFEKVTGCWRSSLHSFWTHGSCITELITTFKCTTTCIATKTFASFCNKQGTLLGCAYDVNVLSGSLLSQTWLEVLTFFFRNSLKFLGIVQWQFCSIFLYFHKVCVSCFVELECAWVQYGGLYLGRFCCYKCVVKQWRTQESTKRFFQLALTCRVAVVVLCSTKTVLISCRVICYLCSTTFALAISQVLFL